MDLLMLSLCCISNPGLLCGSLTTIQSSLIIVLEDNGIYPIHLQCVIGNYIWMDGCWLAVNLVL